MGVDDSYFRYLAAKAELKAAHDGVEQLSLYAFALAELFHPGFLKELNNVLSKRDIAEGLAIIAAVEAGKL